jgi:hypothetical protein
MVTVSFVGTMQLPDTDFNLDHYLSSSEIEYHKLIVPLKSYKLGQRFKEILASGDDESCVLGLESSAKRYISLKYS